MGSVRFTGIDIELNLFPRRAVTTHSDPEPVASAEADSVPASAETEPDIATDCDSEFELVLSERRPNLEARAKWLYACIAVRIRKSAHNELQLALDQIKKRTKANTAAWILGQQASRLFGQLLNLFKTHRV